MTVPIAAMNEYNFSLSRQYDVRRTRKIPAMKAVSIAAPMQSPSNLDLRPGVFRSNRLHDLAPGRGVHMVNHLAPNVVSPKLSVQFFTCNPYLACNATN